MARAVARLDEDADVAVRVDGVFLVLEQPCVARELVLEIVVDDRVLEPEGGAYGAVVGREKIEDEENADGGEDLDARPRQSLQDELPDIVALLHLDPHGAVRRGASRRARGSR